MSLQYSSENVFKMFLSQVTIRRHTVFLGSSCWWIEVTSSYSTTVHSSGIVSRKKLLNYEQFHRARKVCLPVSVKNAAFLFFKASHLKLIF